MQQIQAGHVPNCKNGLHAMMCWAARDFMNLGNGVSFKVTGRKLKGTVKVVYQEGADWYDIHFLNLRGREISKLDGIYCDQLAELIDGVIEQ